MPNKIAIRISKSIIILETKSLYTTKEWCYYYKMTPAKKSKGLGALVLGAGIALSGVTLAYAKSNDSNPPENQLSFKTEEELNKWYQSKNKNNSNKSNSKKSMAGTGQSTVNNSNELSTDELVDLIESTDTSKNYNTNELSDSEKCLIDAKLSLMGFTSRNTDDQSRVDGNGIAPRAELFMKGRQLYASGDLDFKTYDADMFFQHSNKIANFKLANTKFDAVLGYILDKEAYFGLGFNSETRNAIVDIIGFGVGSHSERLSGPVLNLGYKSLNNAFEADIKYKGKTGAIEDTLNSLTNTEPVKDGSELTAKLKITAGGFDTELEIGQEKYDSNGETKNTAYKLGFFKDISNKIRVGFSMGGITTERQVSSYKANQTYINLGLTYKLQKRINKHKK